MPRARSGLKRRKKVKKRIPLEREVFDLSVALRRFFCVVRDTDLLRILLRIALFDVKTEKARVLEMASKASDYISRERIYYGRGRSSASRAFEQMVVHLLPEDLLILEEIKGMLKKFTRDEKFNVDTTSIRFLVSFYGELLVRHDGRRGKTGTAAQGMKPFSKNRLPWTSPNR